MCYANYNTYAFIQEELVQHRTGCEIWTAHASVSTKEDYNNLVQLLNFILNLHSNILVIEAGISCALN